MAIDSFQTRSQKKASSKQTPTDPVVTPPAASRSGLMKPTETDYDDRLEQSIRPQSLQDYIGQSALKKSIEISIKASQQRAEPLEHLLLYGPPGLGKTSLALVLSHEMNTRIQITAAPALERPRDVVGLLMSLEPGDILFIDEIHRLNKIAEEILYPAMEDFVLDRTIGKGHAAKTLRVPLPKFTLVGATTKAGSLSSPLRDRFGLIHRLNYYTLEELTQIIHRAAGILNIDVAAAGAETIAKRGRGTPRIVNRLLRRVRDYVLVEHQDSTTISEAHAEAALDLFEIDPLGLDATDRQLLAAMAEKFNGGPVGIESLATAIGEDARTLEEVYEPYLVQAGLLLRTPRGRMMTPAAITHLGLQTTPLAVQPQLFTGPSEAPTFSP